MTKHDDDSAQQLLPPENDVSVRALNNQNVGEGIPRPVGWFRRLFSVDETLWGLRKATERARAHTEYFDATKDALTALQELQVLPETLADAHNRDKVRLDKEHQKLMGQFALEDAQMAYDLEKITRAQKRLKLQDELERARAQDEIATLKNKQKTAGTQTKETQVDPAVRKARMLMEEIERQARIEEELSRMRDKRFAEIDALVERGELSAEEGASRKEFIQDKIKLHLMEP